MNIIYFLIPITVIIAALLIWLFMWTIKSNQFDDLEGPAYKILMDDDKLTSKKKTPEKNKQSDTALKQASKQPSNQASNKNRD